MYLSASVFFAVACVQTAVMLDVRAIESVALAMFATSLDMDRRILFVSFSSQYSIYWPLFISSSLY